MRSHWKVQSVLPIYSEFDRFLSIFQNYLNKMVANAMAKKMVEFLFLPRVNFLLVDL